MPTPRAPGLSPSVRRASCPAASTREDYTLEYGTATLELHMDDLRPGMRVLILDDVLATGGTLAASARLFERAGVQVSGFGVVLELAGLRGRANLAGRRIRSLVRE